MLEVAVALLELMMALELVALVVQAAVELVVQEQLLYLPLA
jgi:hypothetical protein